MKVLFLDIDGVVNCQFTTARSGYFIGIDPYMAFLVGRIIDQTSCDVVLSSSWRYHEDSCEEVRQKVCKFIDVTPKKLGMTSRGTEIKEWLSAHPEVKKYAILDDNSDMLEEQMPNFFKCAWDSGITEELANKVIAHLK